MLLMMRMIWYWWGILSLYENELLDDSKSPPKVVSIRFVYWYVILDGVFGIYIYKYVCVYANSKVEKKDLLFEE